jgi:hypothetical protein
VRREPVSLRRHKRQCSVCKHPQCAEIEREFLNWESPAQIATDYGLTDRDVVYRHASALGLSEKRRKNLRAALERIVEKVKYVEVNGATVVAAIQALAKINAQGQWVERSEHVDLNELFERMSRAEMEQYAAHGTLPEWFEQFTGATHGTDGAGAK